MTPNEIEQEAARLNAQAQRSHDDEMREFGEWVMEEEDERVQQTT